jgi:hypothetical protein
MNTPITAHSKALADEGRCAAEELVKAKHQIVAELARVTAENTRLHSDAKRLKDRVIELALVLSEYGEQCRKEAETLADGWAATHANGRGHAYEQSSEKLRAALAAHREA